MSDFNLGHDLMVVRSSSTLGVQPAWESLSPSSSAPPLLAHTGTCSLALSLSLSLWKKKKKGIHFFFTSGYHNQAETVKINRKEKFCLRWTLKHRLNQIKILNQTRENDGNWHASILEKEISLPEGILVMNDWSIIFGLRITVPEGCCNKNNGNIPL